MMMLNLPIVKNGDDNDGDHPTIPFSLITKNSHNAGDDNYSDDNDNDYDDGG